MNSLEQQIARYEERNKSIQRRFLDNTKVNAQMVRRSNNRKRNKSQSQAIKVRELRTSSLRYGRHMKWLYHPYD
ncbi:hypothetical protein [Fructobacillus tropaeoli]|uniref:hypothetical protein n=1 Tax=Fructobacillus tropaeoli TaxID=709323 RepID=UPI002DABB556|nr:unnamed protein product [Fructobacillus tropaeoli]